MCTNNQSMAINQGRYTKKQLTSQTTPGAQIKQLVAGFGVMDTLRIYAAAEYVRALPIVRDRRWGKLFMRRTAEQIVVENFATGCSDRALVFSAMLQSLGYTTRIIETIHQETLQGRVHRTGHMLVEVFHRDHGWLLLEPTTGERIDSLYRKTGFIHVQTLPDFWSIGINNYRDFINRFDMLASRTKIPTKIH